jgi:hypothetical protein
MPHRKYIAGVNTDVRILLWLGSVVISHFLFVDLALTQYSGPNHIDFGIGYFEIFAPTSDSLMFYSTPESHANPIALLKGTQLTFLRSHIADDITNRLIEIVYNDDYGLPILEISADSNWARVALNPKNKVDTQAAWVSLERVRNDVGGWQLWGQFFTPDEPVTFLSDSMMGFYSALDDTMKVFPKLLRSDGEMDYCMRVIQTKGLWMEVYLETPSTFMTDPVRRHARYESKNPPPRLWIKFLDQRGRPRIWFLWD